MRWLSLAFWILARPADASAPTSCGGLERDLSKDLSLSVMAMEPEGTLRSVQRRATEGLKQCPDSETLGYLSVRAAELGVSPTSDDVGKAAYRAFAKDTSQRFPRSARIATVRARAERTVAAARSAVSLDSTYSPAKIV